MRRALSNSKLYPEYTEKKTLTRQITSKDGRQRQKNRRERNRGKSRYLTIAMTYKLFVYYAFLLLSSTTDVGESPPHVV